MLWVAGVMPTVKSRSPTTVRVVSAVAVTPWSSVTCRPIVCGVPAVQVPPQTVDSTVLQGTRTVSPVTSP